jgi:acyl-[acyl-carrier-protein]-phospholipid O-acyltransferase/long-chain-fatty-acid--[acyl-carrier-protein] ligase
VAVFPEGRLSVTGALMKIYEGPALAADKADAALLPVYIEGAQYSLLSRLGGIVRRRLLPRIRLTMLPPRRLTRHRGNSRARRQQLGRQLDELMIELAYAGMNIDQPLASAMLEAWERHGGGRGRARRRPATIGSGAVRAVARLAPSSSPNCWSRIAPGRADVGLLLPNSAAAVVALLALHLRGQVPVLLNFTAGSHELLGACRTAQVRTVCTSRAFVATANLQPHIATLASTGYGAVSGRFAATGDAADPAARAGAGAAASVEAFASWPGTVRGDDPAVILFTSGSEREPKGVVLTHRNLLANVAQARAVFDITPRDVILNALPLFHAFGLTTATLTPLLLGTRLILYPVAAALPRHPGAGLRTPCATVLFGTNTFLMGYGRHADPYDFFSVRLVVMGAEALRDETRRLWAEKFGIRISEGYG